MDTGPLLERLADRYRGQGYAVTVHPGPDAMPSFAKDFRVELLAERSDGKVLVSAKADADEFESDLRLVDLAELVAEHRGWRFDLSLLGPPVDRPRPRSRSRDAEDLTAEQVAEQFGQAIRLYDAGFEPPAALAAWAAFESAMRHRVRGLGRKAGYGASPRSLLDELHSSGELTHRKYRELEDLMDLRNIIVHGFRPTPVGRAAIELLAEAGLGLMEGLEIGD